MALGCLAMHVFIFQVEFTQSAMFLQEHPESILLVSQLLVKGPSTLNEVNKAKGGDCISVVQQGRHAENLSSSSARSSPYKDLEASAGGGK